MVCVAQHPRPRAEDLDENPIFRVVHLDEHHEPRTVRLCQQLGFWMVCVAQHPKSRAVHLDQHFGPEWCALRSTVELEWCILISTLDPGRCVLLSIPKLGWERVMAHNNGKCRLLFY